MGMPIALADPYFDSGITLYKNKNYSKALPYFNQAMSSNPYDPNALYYFAITCQNLGDRKNAIKAYARLISQFTDSQARSLAVNALNSLDPQYCRQLLRPADYLGGGGAHSASSSTARTYSAIGGTDSGSSAEQVRVDFTRRDSYSNLLVVEGRLNNRDCRFLFDTGASDCCVGKNTLKELGIQLPVGPPTTHVSGVGSNTSSPAWEMYLDLKVGAISRKVKFIVMDLRDEPLIGQTFFHDYIYTIDTNSGSSNGTISFVKRSGMSGQQESSTSSVRFERAGSGHIIVPVDVDGKKVKMIFDTGASSIVFTRDQLKALQMTVPEDAVAVSNSGVTGSTTGRLFNVRRIRMGPIDKADMQVNVVDDANMAFPLLGQSFFSDWKYTLDYDRNILNLQKR